MYKSTAIAIACLLIASCDDLAPPDSEEPVPPKHCHYEIVSVTFAECTGSCPLNVGNGYGTNEQCDTKADCLPTNTSSRQCSEDGYCNFEMELDGCQ